MRSIGMVSWWDARKIYIHIHIYMSVLGKALEPYLMKNFVVVRALV